MRVFALSQGSSEWLLWRQYGIGSSDAPVILNGRHFERDRLQLWKEKRGEKPVVSDNTYRNMRMRRGQILEGDVRHWYEQIISKTVKPLCAMHATKDYLKASLDGWEPVSRTILEIKCPGKKDHQSALDREIPSKYLPQLQHQLLVSGASRVHYLSYNPAFDKADRYALVTYLPDREDLELLETWETLFWGCVLTGLTPDDSFFIRP